MSKRKHARKGSAPVSAPVPSARSAAFLKRVQDRPWLTVGLLATVVLVAIYSVALRSPTLILHEDSILRLPLLSHVRNVPHILSRDFLLFSSGQFRPLSYVLLAAVRTFAPSESLLFWHLWLLGFHALNTLLVVAIARHFTHRLTVALTAAAIFGLHPLCTVIVNDINQFYMLFGLTLSLGSLRAYLSFTRNRKKTLYFAAVVLFFLALVTARATLCLGLVFLVYELAYQRSGLKRALSRLWPFVLIPVALFPLWAWYTPHPLHYKYMGLYKGSFWHGLFSVTGATRQYAGGLVLTRGIPAVLHDAVEQIFRWNNPKFLFWAAFNVVLLVIGIVALAKRLWAGLGILFMFIAMIPYATISYNRVVDYVSWTYLYFPVVGFALLVSGVHELVARARRQWVRVAGQAVLAAGFLFLGLRSLELNSHSRSPLAYWKHVSELNEKSQTALYETGKAHLARGELPIALHYFFAPMVKDLKYPCLVMARYYCRQGNPVACAIHLRLGSIEEKTGMILEDYCDVAGEVLLAAGALDHAEENFGKILMVNPFNASAMARLAQVWFLKGFVREARRMLRRARALAPNDRDIGRVEKDIEEAERSLGDNPQPLTVTPAKPDWLRYVLTQVRTPSLRREIVALSETADPNDAVIQLEAMISLLEDKEYKAAAAKAPTVLYCLSGNSYACAAACRAFALAGDVEQAVELGLRAVSLDSQSNLAWGSLGLAIAVQEKPDARTQKFVDAVARHPASGAVFYYNLGLQKKQTGKTEQAAELFEKTVQIQPNHLEALRALGDSLVSLGKFERAGEALQKALAIDASDAKTHANVGVALLSLGKDAEGIEALRTAIKLDPKSATYHHDLGVGFAKVQNEEESMQELRRAVELDPRLVKARYNLANSLVKAGKVMEAIVEYREVVKLSPAYPHVHYNLGAALHRLEKIDEAITEYHEEVRHNPRFAPAYDILVSLHSEKGEHGVAQELAKRASELGVKLDPGVLEALRSASPDEKKE